MNEAERYLKERLNEKTSNDMQTAANHSAMEAQQQQPDVISPSVLTKKQGSSAGKYVLAIAACVGILLLYTLIAHAMHWQYGGGYLVKTIILITIIVVWKAITRK